MVCSTPWTAVLLNDPLAVPPRGAGEDSPAGGSSTGRVCVMRREREDLLAFYTRYLQRCNEHRFDEIGEFVADDVNGPTDGLSRYIAGLHAVVDAFPDC